MKKLLKKAVRLKMKMKMDSCPHAPVFAKKIEEIINKISKEMKIDTIVDCTFGAGGHSRIFAPFCKRLVAIDRDQSVYKFVETINNVEFFVDSFSNLSRYVEKATLIFADLGLSTMQLDSDRGFSFMTNSDLDMRMGDGPSKLRHLLKKMPVFRMKEIIQKYGEEPSATKIANNIDKFRLKKEIQTTFDLREAIGIDKFPVLARVFQAFRIFVNEELRELEILLEQIPKIASLSMIISFHSLEDRLVKAAFKRHFKFHTLFIPSEEEILENSRARSAKLRFGSAMDLSEKN